MVNKICGLMISMETARLKLANDIQNLPQQVIVKKL